MTNRLLLTAVFATAAIVSPAGVIAQHDPDTDTLLRQELQEGEAVVWHLFHAGWAIRTSRHFLIFDYWEPTDPAGAPSLANGFIDATQLRDLNVVVFVSHGHSDHFDPVIFRWREVIRDITYVFGWEAASAPEYNYLTTPRADVEIDGVRVRAVNHEFDGVPEVAFVIEVDGLVLFHSGDHGSTGDQLNPVFERNIDYLRGLHLDVDIAFLSVFGRRGGGVVNRGDLYTIEQLRPSVTFPMHRGGAEASYAEWAHAIEQTGAPTTASYARKPGDVFLYRDGGIQR